MLRVLIIHDCPLFRVGLRSFLLQQEECCVVGEAVCLDEVLVLVNTQHPDIALLDGGLASADPLALTQRLRLLGVQGILVFASPAADEEELFRFLKHGATAYEPCWISGEELLAKLYRMQRGVSLITGDILAALAARRERLAHLRQALLLAAHADEADPAVGAPSPLTEQERAVLEQVARGCTMRQAARALGISYDSARTFLASTYRKLAVYDRTGAVVVALRRRWIAVEGVDLPADRL